MKRAVIDEAVDHEYIRVLPRFLRQCESSLLLDEFTDSAIAISFGKLSHVVAIWLRKKFL